MGSYTKPDLFPAAFLGVLRPLTRQYLKNGGRWTVNVGVHQNRQTSQAWKTPLEGTANRPVDLPDLQNKTHAQVVF